MSASAADLAAKCAATGSRLTAVPRAGVTEAALAAKGVMLAEAAKAGATRLSGVGRKGARVGVGFDVKGGVNATAIVSYRGPAHLANNPTRPHEITPRKGGRGRQGKRALSTPDGAFARVQHPGTRGKQFFEAAAPKVAAQTRAIFRQEVRRQLVSVWGG